MMATSAVLAFVVAFISARVLLARFRRLALDQPNARSLHASPVPRTGGIAVLLGAGVSATLGALELWLPMSLAAALAVLSFVDDVRGVPTGVRFAAHVAAAAALVWFVLAPMDPIQMAVLVAAVAWITNLYNFMDGSDGLAAGMATIGFGVYAQAAYMTDHLALAALSVGLATASAAFLLHNYHPARIFLGDVGSIPLGFLAGALGVTGWRDDVWPLWFPVLVFAPFIGDATLTLIKRSLRGERVWQAHRQHYYQRMVLMGLGHRRTAWIAYVAMGLCGLAALAGREQAPPIQAAIFLAATAILGAGALWVDLRWARFSRAGRAA